MSRSFSGWIAVAGLAGLAGLFLAAAPARAAEDEALGFERTPPRLSFVDGEVSFFRPGAQDWAPASVNTPLAAGDELYAAEAANLELQIGPRAYVRAGEATQLALSSLEPDFLQFRVTEGHVSLDLRTLNSSQTIEIDTPNAAFTIERIGYYRVEVTDDATAFITRRGGRARLTPASGVAADLAASEQVVISGGDAPQIETYAAPELDAWDRWNYARTDAQLDAVSARYVPYGVYGVDDLDHHGTWRVVPTYGAIWVPRGVAVGWTPYSTGRWIYDPYYGWTWIDAAPWGWAPYHYGRWVHVSGYWGWAPGPQRLFGVLLVDDNPHHRILLLRALRDQGHSVLHAADGASGETLCRASQLEIDALVACADMKRMSGFELARRVGRMRPEVRVLLMWRQFAGAEEACRAYGRGYAVIEEPFTPAELCCRLRGLLAPPNDACAQSPGSTLKTVSSRARAKSSPSVPRKRTDCPRRSIHGTERRPGLPRRPVGDWARGVAAREPLLVRATPSRGASALRLSRLRGRVIDDAIAGDEWILSAQRRGDRRGADAEVAGQLRARVHGRRHVRCVLRGALGLRRQTTPARVGGHAEPVRELCLRRESALGSASPGTASRGHPGALGGVGNAESGYTHFAYSYARSAEDAYPKEWRNYDAFGGSYGLDNETQPVSAARDGELTCGNVCVTR